MITIIERDVIVVEVESSTSSVAVVSEPEISVEISQQAGIPAGGLQGQTLKKRSGNDYDAEWSTSGAAYYTHNQQSAATEWIINHNLGRYPAISVMSVGLVEVLSDVVHVSANQARVYFSQPYAGLAQCI